MNEGVEKKEVQEEVAKEKQVEEEEWKEYGGGGDCLCL